MPPVTNRATACIAAGASDPLLLRDAEHVLGRVCAAYDPATTFGYRGDDPVRRQHADSPGLLEGASGFALALHSHLDSARRRPYSTLS
jgi:hypothetical protein